MCVSLSLLSRVMLSYLSLYPWTTTKRPTSRRLRNRCYLICSPHQSVCLLVLASSSASPWLKFLFKLRKPMTRPFESLRKDKEKKSKNLKASSRCGWDMSSVIYIAEIVCLLFKVEKLCKKNSFRRHVRSLRFSLELTLSAQHIPHYTAEKKTYSISYSVCDLNSHIVDVDDDAYIYTMCVEIRYTWNSINHHIIVHILRLKEIKVLKPMCNHHRRHWK